MKEENVNMDKTFRNKLEGFSVKPPPHVWDNLQGQLLAQQKQKRMVYFAWITAAAVVFLAFVAGWYFNNNSITELPILVQEQSNLSEENAVNSESIQNEESELNDEKKEAVKTENKLSAKPTLIAANTPSDNTKDKTDFSAKTKAVNTTDSFSERIRMNQMESKNVKFFSLKPETKILEKSIEVGEYNFSNPDDLILAANFSTFKKNNTPETGWKMGMYISPGYSSNVSSHSQSYAQNMDDQSKSGNGNMGGGVSVQYKTSKKLRIESGVYYAQSGQKSSSSVNLFSRNNEMYDMAFAPGDAMQSNVPATGFSNAVNLSNGNMLMNSTAGVIEMNGAPKGAQINTAPEMLSARYSNTLVTDGEFSQVFDFIEIPLYLRYNLLDSKFGIELMGGINAGLIVGNNAYIDNSYGLQNIGKTQDISTLNLSGTIGVGANYALGKHISVAIEPRLNYYFNSINNNPSVDFRPYRIGFFTGVYYEF